MSVYECRLSDGVTLRGWGHSNPTKIICLNFLNPQVVGMQKLWAQVIVPRHECPCPKANIVELSQHLISFGVIHGSLSTI